MESVKKMKNHIQSASYQNGDYRFLHLPSERFPDGPLVVFFPGFGYRADGYRKFLHMLHTENDVSVPIAAVYNASNVQVKPNESGIDPILTKYVDPTEDILDRIAPEQALIIVAHSKGAIQAIELAYRRPSQVKKILLVCPAGYANKLITKPIGMEMQLILDSIREQFSNYVKVIRGKSPRARKRSRDEILNGFVTSQLHMFKLGAHMAGVSLIQFFAWFNRILESEIVNEHNAHNLLQQHASHQAKIVRAIADSNLSSLTQKLSVDGIKIHAIFGTEDRLFPYKDLKKTNVIKHSRGIKTGHTGIFSSERLMRVLIRRLIHRWMDELDPNKTETKKP